MYRLESEGEIAWVESDADGLVFGTDKEFQKLADAENLSKGDLTDIWNRLVGKPQFDDINKLKKFRNRPYGIQQIWKAIQRLDPANVKETDNDTNEAVEAKAPKAKKARRVASSNSNGFREGTKAAEALQMIRRDEGASLDELMKANKWQRHTVRGFVSTLGSKHGVKVTAEKHESKGLVYKA